MLSASALPLSLGPLAWIDGFLHPALAAGALLAAVPLVIHLFNRQRHKPMSWAAMRFVEAAWKRTRRRARLEELLLLILRMAAVALLALALARPFAGGASPLAVLTERRRDVIAILDTSASTGYRDGTRTVFDTQLERAKQLLLELNEQRGDRARVIAAGSTPRLLAWRSKGEALAALETLERPSDERGDLAAALSEAARWVEEDAAAAASEGVEVWIFHDLQRLAFLDAPRAAVPAPGDGPGAAVSAPGNSSGAAVPAPGNSSGAAVPAPGSLPSSGPATLASPARLVGALERLEALQASIRLVDVGALAAPRSNAGVVSIEVEGGSLIVGEPAEVVVEVKNHSLQSRLTPRLSLSVDGERRPTQTLEIAAGGSQRARFPLLVNQAGEHMLEARLDGDALAFDDARCQVEIASPPIDVLVVNGEPSSDLELDEVAHVLAALEPPRGDDAANTFAPFAVRAVEAAALAEPSFDPAAHDVILLANLNGLGASAAARLEQAVARGLSLVISVGKNSDAGRPTLNARWFKEDGSGLLPAPLGLRQSVADRRLNWWRAKEFDRDHPALSFFADERWQALLTEVPIYDFLSFALPSEGAAPARALIRLDDERSSPLLVERAFDRGKVFLWLTTIDAEWARVAQSPGTFVPLLHELVRYAGQRGSLRRNVSLGGSVRLEVGPGAFPGAASAVFEDGARRALSGEPTALGSSDGSDGWMLPALEGLDTAGAVRVETTGAGTLLVALQADPEEGAQERIEPGQLRQIHPALAPEETNARAQAAAEDPAQPRGELWRVLAAACLAVLAAETLYAAWLGTRRGGRA